ncbi:tetratricopeptide repeat protein [Luteimonas pelagia]
MRAWLPVIGFAFLLGACASAPPPVEAPVLTTATPAQQVAAVRAVAGVEDTELAVAPLRDPRIGDLRARASAAERAGQPADAAAAIDEALAIAPGDPELLQERAEVALLLGQPADAERLARQAWGLGSKVGPLCRRHWATVEQARLVAGDADGAAEAKAAIGACTLGRPPRY